MFNRTPFNRTAHNRSASLTFRWSATVHGETESSGLISLEFRLNGSADAVSQGAATLVCVLLPSALAEAEAVALGDYIRTRFLETVAHAESEAHGTQVSVYELITIVLNDLNMKAGDLLVIDTEHMTVTLNGINVVDKIPDDSGFFDLNSGDNQITISDAGKVDVTILWKDRWL